MQNIQEKLGQYKKPLLFGGMAIILGGAGIGGGLWYYNTQQVQQSANVSQALYLEEEVALGDIIVGITESGVAYLQGETVSYDYQMDVSNVLVVTGEFVTAGTPICDVILTDQDDYQDAYDSQLATLERQLESAYTALSMAQTNAELDRIKAAEELAENQSAVTDVEESNYIDQFGWSTDLQEFTDTLNDLNIERSELIAELYEGYDYSDYEKLIENYEEQIEDIEDSMDDLYDDLDDYDDQIDDIEDEIDDIEDEITALEQAIDAAQDAVQDTEQDTEQDDETDVADLEKQLESKQSELEAAEKSKESLEDAADKAEEDLDDRYDDYEEQIDDIYETMEEAELDLYEAVQDWMENLNDQIDSVDDSIAKTSTSLEAYNLTLATNQKEAQSKYDSAVTTVQTAQMVYDAELLSISENLSNCYEDIADIQEEIEDLELDALSETVVAPCDGYVTAIAEEGATVNADTAILTLGKGGNFEVITSISQDDITEVYVGMIANVVLDPYDEYTLPAVVESITLTPSSAMSTTVNYTVTLLCDTSDYSDIVVYQGMSGDATFVQKQVLDVLILSNKTIKTVDGVQTVQVKKPDGTLETVNIQTGFSDGFDTEVISGLAEGDIVILESAVSYASN